MVLAFATYAAVRSSNRSAGIAERSMMVGVRPLVVSSRLDDAEQKVLFREGYAVHVPGGGAAVEAEDDAVYLAISLRNVGQGIAVLDRWWLSPQQADGSADHADPRQFRRLTIDLYLPAGHVGYWQGALHDPGSTLFEEAAKAAQDRQPMTVELLYGDHLGGQHAIVRLALRPMGDARWLATVVRHWNLDEADPR